MNFSRRHLLPGAAIVAAVVGASSTASALTTVYDPNQNGQYCVAANAGINGVTPDGHSLNIVGWADASLWNNGGCNGAPAPENAVYMQARIWYQPPSGQPFVVYDLPTNGTWQQSSYDLWGVYLATLNDVAPLSGIDVAEANFYGDGWYSVEVTAYIDEGGAWQGGSTYSPWTYAKFSY
jgi:hypothetical protein